MTGSRRTMSFVAHSVELLLTGVKVVEKEDSDVMLPCSLNTKENIEFKLFDWKKVAQKDAGEKEVFMYDKGKHYNNGQGGQSEQFKGRVSHFQDELKHGDASIIIRNTKISDSGEYTCDFPRLQPPQKFYIELVVESILKDRSGENPVASPEPYIRTLKATADWALLQCEVRRAAPKPKVEWQDSAGNTLPAEEPQTSERGGSYYITLNTTVTKTGRYRCVVTQEEISHQTQAETFVHISGKVCEDSSGKAAIGWMIVALVLGVLIVVAVAVLALLVLTKSITIHCNKGSHQQGIGLREQENGLGNQGNGLGNQGNGLGNQGNGLGNQGNGLGNQRNGLVNQGNGLGNQGNGSCEELSELLHSQNGR